MFNFINAIIILLIIIYYIFSFFSISFVASKSTSSFEAGDEVFKVTDGALLVTGIVAFDEDEGVVDGFDNLISNAFKANALLRSASALALPGNDVPLLLFLPN